MQFDQYVTARRGRLVEHAVALGCAEDDAPTYVDTVLSEQRRRIERADDPDPLVREAVERGLLGTRAPGPSPRLLVGGAVLLVAVLVAVALLQRPPPQPSPLPSVFGYDGDAARRLLEDAGFEVALTTTAACEPRGRVVSTAPAAGEPLAPGAAVTLRTAMPTGPFCEARYPFRSTAWDLIDFARGGADPGFAETVRVVVDGSDPLRLSGDDPALLEQWGGALDPLAEAVGATVATSNGLPRLIVESARPPDRQCGIPRPALGGTRAALRLQLDPVGYGTARSDCPLTVDAFRSEAGIDAVVVYSGHQDGNHHLAYAPPPWADRPSADGVVGPGLRLDP